MRNKKLWSLLILILLITSCKQSNNKTNTTSQIREISLRHEWFPSACYAGDIEAADLAKLEDDISIDINIGSEELDPIKMIISGENNVGISSLDRVIEANNKGANLIAIGVVNYISPTCFITLKKNEFNKVQDFKKYKVGVFTGNNTEMIYELLLKTKGISRNDINEVEASWDLNSFINDIYEIRPSFIYDELVSLDIQNIEYNVLYPSDFGVDFIGPVYFTTRKIYDNNKPILKKYLKLTAKGWKNAIENPKKSIKKLKVFSNDIDVTRETKSLIKGSSYFLGENDIPLYVSDERIIKMGENLVDLGILKEAKDIYNSIDLSLLPNKTNINEF